MGKKSYSAISKEIEEMKTNGLDDDTISHVLRAKYNESSIERIYNEAQWERENQIEEIDDKDEGLSKRFKISVGILSALVIFALGYAFVGMFSYSSNTGTTSTTSYKPTKRDAYYMSQQLLKKKLKAPSTAIFPRYQEGMYVEEIGDNEYLITAYVDAENSFGAKIRSTYMSQVKHLHGETWRDKGTYLIE